MASSKRWIISTSGERPLPEVRKKLKQAGFAVDQVLDAIGCITGAAGDDVAERARAIPGVADVSEEGGVDVGPPNSSVTW